MTDIYDKLHAIALDALDSSEALTKADLSVVLAPPIPAAYTHVSVIAPTGNWAIDTAILGFQSVLRGRAATQGPTEPLKLEIPESRAFADYKGFYEAYAKELPEPQIFKPVITDLENAIRNVVALVRYQPPEPQD